MMDIQQDRERIISILHKYELLCKSENEVCSLSKQGHGCNCGKIYEEIRNA